MCTTTAPTEGWHTFSAVATDDDYATTVATIDIQFTNIAPYSASVALQKNGQFLASDEQQIWHLDEDEEVIVKGQALDSIDDLETLTHTWWPDSEQPSLMYTFTGRTSDFAMQWNTAGLHTVRLEVSDNDGEASQIEERWISIRNVPPVIQPLASLLPVAEGQMITVEGNSTDTPSDVATLTKCWDVDPGIDSDDIGGADDDCDVPGDVLNYAWNRSGSHTIIYHVTDDDGAQSSEVLTIEVLNMPPIVRLQNTDCIAYRECYFNADKTTDSLNDIDGLTIVWDLDITQDSNGDGIKDNDADLVGSSVSHIFRQAGTVNVKAMAWDENPERPGQAVMSVVVAPPERTSLEQVSAALIGDEANALAQLGLLIATLLILALLTRRRKTNPAQTHGKTQILRLAKNKRKRSLRNMLSLNKFKIAGQSIHPLAYCLRSLKFHTISHLLLSPSNLNCQPLQLSPKPVSKRFNKRNFIHQFQKVGCQKVGLKSNGRITGNNTSMPNPLILTLSLRDGESSLSSRRTLSE